MLKICFAILFLLNAAIAEDQLFKFGVIQSLSGIASEYGETSLNSIRMAVDEIKEAGGEIEYILEDDRSDSKNTVLAYKKLKTQGVRLIVGPTWSFHVNSILPLVGKDEIILFNTTTLPEGLNLELSAGYGFTNCLSAKAAAGPFKEYLKKHAIKSLSIFYINNSYGEALLESFKKIINEHKIKILSETISINYDENNWRETLPKLKKENPDLVLMLLNHNDIDILAKRLSEIKYAGKIFAAQNAYDAYLNSNAKQVYEGICLTYPLKQLTNNQGFFDKYKMLYKEAPKITADHTYDAIKFLYKTFQESEGDYDKFRENLKASTYEGVGNQYTYTDKYSFASGKSSLVCIKNQEVVF